MVRILATAFVVLTLLCSTTAFATCTRFTGSTMDISGVPRAEWRADYPSVWDEVSPQWQSISYRSEPQKYLASVLETVKADFRRVDRKLIGTGREEWWISLWLDYTNYGREPLMGLTKERGPDPGDLSPISGDEYQVWAVGFYNAPGGTVLGKIFTEPCNPQLPGSVDFPEGTVAVKFLFTDAPPDEVSYLRGAPEYDAYIDKEGAGGQSLPVAERQLRTVRLLQVDLSVKDKRASNTEWVFGTFAWVGPTKGDGVFDNLVPVSLQWGNDPGVYDTSITESWINPDLSGVLYGWAKRPTLGFNGRANGPADNIRSSCLSCHAAGRIPRSSKGLLGSRFNMEDDIKDRDKVRAHVDVWFVNLEGGELFDPAEPAISALDYSLQIDAAIFRMCRACRTGSLSGTTPDICRAAKFHDAPTCRAPGIMLDATIAVSKEAMEDRPPPRQ